MKQKLPVEFGKMTHEMSNALAYVVTNLNLMTELNETKPDQRLTAILADAMEGSERLGQLLRNMRRASWGDPLPTQEEEVQQTGPPSNIRRILVIDDETAILSAVKRALRPHTVEVVTTGEAALAQIDGGADFDLVLCDLILTGMSGIEVYNELRSTAPEQADRLVFMTGGGFTPDVRNFLADVQNGILHKPFDVKTLRWIVSQKLAEAEAAR